MASDEVAAEEERRKVEKPQLSLSVAVHLARKLFGMDVDEARVKQLESYDDVNFYLACRGGEQYVFKVHNGVESDNVEFLTGMNELLLHLRKHKIQAPFPLSTSDGQWMVKVEQPLKNGQPKLHAVRVLEYVRGEMMNEQEMTPGLLFQSGCYLGQLDKILDGFDHPGFHRNHAWDVRNTSMLRSFFQYLDEPWRRELVESVVEDFERVILPAARDFKMGLLQGDFNDANIIVQQVQGAPVPCGIIDFGDAVHSWRVNDVAIALAYVMVCICNPENKRSGFGDDTAITALEAAAHFLQGFLSMYPLQPPVRCGACDCNPRA